MKKYFFLVYCYILCLEQCQTHVTTQKYLLNEKNEQHYEIDIIVFL
jgi:hypothetical protein